jgi:hypothetical protein
MPARGSAVPVRRGSGIAITLDNLHLSEPILDAGPARQSHGGTADLGPLDAVVRELLEAAAAPNTRRAYQSDLRHFRAWGGSVPATPELVVRYLAHHARPPPCRHPSRARPGGLPDRALLLVGFAGAFHRSE